jgi:hypothetical protein
MHPRASPRVRRSRRPTAPTVDARWICAQSFTGLATGASGYLTGTPPAATVAFGGTTFTLPSITPADADALIFGMISLDSVTADVVSWTSTGANEIQTIFNGTTTEGASTGYRIVSSIAAYALAGTFSVAPGEQGYNSVAYKAAASTASAAPPPAARPLLPLLQRFSPFRAPLFPAPQVPATAATGPFNYTQDLPATLSFTGGFTKQPARALTATLSFVGAFLKRTISGLHGDPQFPRGARHAQDVQQGADGDLVLHRGVRQVDQPRHDGGARVHRGVRQGGRQGAFSATLSFTGALTKLSPRAFTATLSFTGAIATLKAFGKALTASLSFTGSFAKLPTKALTATLSFTGAMPRRIVHGLTATLSFTGLAGEADRPQPDRHALVHRGVRAEQVVPARSDGTLSFTGSLASQKLLNKALTATLSFTGSMTRRTGKSLAATLSFAGSMPRRIGRASGRRSASSARSCRPSRGPAGHRSPSRSQTRS